MGLGCMELRQSYPPFPDKKDFIAFLRRAAEMGENFFDTSELYGVYANEELAGEALECPLKKQPEHGLSPAQIALAWLPEQLHIHHKGDQMLLATGGKGWYQAWGGPAGELHPGDGADIPAEVKHWHGAAAASWFSPLTAEATAEGASNEWLEPVTDEQYPKR